MSQEANNLIAGFPLVFKSLQHVECGDGWIPLLKALCEVLENEIEQMPSELQPDFFATQIKEKFGALRFYMNRTTPYMRGAVAMAEHMSYTVCEECGDPGAPCSVRWIRTLCEKHTAEHKEKYDQK